MTCSIIEWCTQTLFITDVISLVYCYIQYWLNVSSITDKFELCASNNHCVTCAMNQTFARCKVNKWKEWKAVRFVTEFFEKLTHTRPPITHALQQNENKIPVKYVHSLCCNHPFYKSWFGVVGEFHEICFHIQSWFPQYKIRSPLVLLFDSLLCVRAAHGSYWIFFNFFQVRCMYHIFRAIVFLILMIKYDSCTTCCL